MSKTMEDSRLSVAELLAFLAAIEIIVDKSESVEEIKKALEAIKSQLTR